MGVGAKGTGFHFDLIIYDDIVGLVASQSRPEMEGAIEWFKLAPGLLHDPEASEEVMIGTRWLYGDQDLYGWEMEHMGTFEWLVRSAIENEQPIFPERFSLATLEAIRKREGDYYFSCQYMNQPIPQGGTAFDSAWLQTYGVSEDLKNIVLQETVH